MCYSGGGKSTGTFELMDNQTMFMSVKLAQMHKHLVHTVALSVKRTSDLDSTPTCLGEALCG